MLFRCGEHVNIRKGAHLSDSITLGDYSGIGENAYLGGTVVIGKDVMMGSDCKFFAINHNTRDCSVPMRTQGFAEDRPIVIEDDVWIGANVIVCAGVHVGKGAILGAGSVIRKDVPPCAVVIGNPAQILRYRKPLE